MCVCFKIIIMKYHSYCQGVLDLLANRCLASGTNAWTDTDHTCYTMTTAGSEGFLQLLPIYVDHILHPTLKVCPLSVISCSLCLTTKYISYVLFGEKANNCWWENTRMKYTDDWFLTFSQPWCVISVRKARKNWNNFINCLFFSGSSLVGCVFVFCLAGCLCVCVCVCSWQRHFVC